MHARIGKWGKGLALRFPGEIVASVGLTEGERVQVEVHEGAIVIHRVAPHFALAEMFAGKTPEQWRAEYKDAFDWGPDVGREVVDA